MFEQIHQESTFYRTILEENLGDQDLVRSSSPDSNPIMKNQEEGTEAMHD